MTEKRETFGKNMLEDAEAIWGLDVKWISASEAFNKDIKILAPELTPSDVDELLGYHDDYEKFWALVAFKRIAVELKH